MSDLFSGKIELWKNVLKLAESKVLVHILSATSVFEFCSSRCRTSSEVGFGPHLKGINFSALI